ncbi:MAG: hypothetical protein WAM66_03000 [Acidobacteriaceae bacterium]
MDLNESKQGMSLAQMKITMVAIAIAAIATGIRVARRCTPVHTALALSLLKIMLVAGASAYLFYRTTQAAEQQKMERARLFCLVVWVMNAVSIMGDSIILSY